MKKLTTSALLIFSGDAAARLFGFLAIVHLGRVLEPHVFGLVIIGSSALQYAVLAADLGLSTIGTREIARPQQEQVFRFGNLLALKLVLAAVAFVVYELLVAVFYGHSAAYPVLALYGFSVLPYALLIEWYFQARGIFVPVTVSRFAGGAIYLAGVYFAVHASTDVVWVPIAFLASTGIAALVLLVGKHSDDSFRPPPMPIRTYIDILKSSAAVSTGGFFAQVVQLLPPLAAGWFLSTAEAGQYGAAMKLLALAMMLDRVFVTLFLPVISRYRSSTREQLTEFLSIVTRGAVLVGFSVSTVLTIVGNSLVVRVFGENFAQAGPLFAILAWFFALTILNSIFSFSLIGGGHDGKYLKATVWGGSLSALLILAGTVIDGIRGTTIAVVLSELLITAMMYSAFKTYFPPVQLRWLWPTAVLALVFAGLCLSLHLTQWWLAPVLWCAFIGAALALNIISRRDIRLVLQR
jgi:O-antigen/teichoic acid export membrane protein